MKLFKVLEAVADYTANTDLRDLFCSDEFLEFVSADPKEDTGLQGGHDLGRVASNAFGLIGREAWSRGRFSHGVNDVGDGHPARTHEGPEEGRAGHIWRGLTNPGPEALGIEGPAGGVVHESFEFFLEEVLFAGLKRTPRGRNAASGRAAAFPYMEGIKPHRVLRGAQAEPRWAYTMQN
ncbi:MAG: hypothetical protein ABII82_18060 [Verrucomicrobiota bacterium]